jgi:hypothetical protein
VFTIVHNAVNPYITQQKSEQSKHSSAFCSNGSGSGSVLRGSGGSGSGGSGVTGSIVSSSESVDFNEFNKKQTSRV